MDKKTTEPVHYIIDHWSYSSMICFLRNPLIFKKRHVLMIGGDQSSMSAMVGKAGHLALKILFGGSDEHIVSPKISEAAPIAIQAGLDYLDKTPDAAIKYGKTGSRQKMIDTYMQAIEFYIKEMPEDWDVVSVEQKVQQHIKGPDDIVFAIPAKGYGDLVKRSKKGELEIVDHKFVSSYTDPDEEDPTKIIQAMFLYHLILGQLGEKPVRILFRECKTSKNADGSQQVREYGIEYTAVPHYFTFFYQLYNDCTKAIIRPDVVFLPNLQDLFDGKDAYFLYQQGLLGVDMSDVEVDHNTHHVKYIPKMNKFIDSTLDTVDADGYPPEERVRIKLGEFGMPVKTEATHHGPSVTLYTFTPSRGLSVKRIEKHAQDIALALRASSVRILAPIPGTNSIGIEVPREERETITLEAKMLESGSFDIPIGVNLYGALIKKDIRQMPHLLVAGATGSGKSVFINTIIHTLTSQLGADKMKLVLIDPKRVELAAWATTPHILDIGHNMPPVIHQPKDAIFTLEWLVEEMERRYKILSKAKAKSIDKFSGDMPYILVVIDEFADLIMSREKYHTEDAITREKIQRTVVGREVEESIVRLAQMARAIGIHLVVGTQRPSVNVLTGLIKANMPTRVAFMTASQMDSKVILDTKGAEELLGKGDMLYMDPSSRGLQRLQGLYLD